MVRSITIAGAAAAVLLGGAISVGAANTHGAAVSKLASSTTLSGEAKGDAVSMVASLKGATTSKAAETDASVDKAVPATSTNSSTAAGGDAHGDAVSLVARSDATAAQTHGAKKVNHGAAVSAVAHKS